MAAMRMKMIMPRLLAKLGYRWVLISNTIVLGILLMVFATISIHTPVWAIVLQASTYGTFTSLQYSRMNTLVYADPFDERTSAASSIASTMQQISISFGAATAGLATAFSFPIDVPKEVFEQQQRNGIKNKDNLQRCLSILRKGLFNSYVLSFPSSSGRRLSHQWR
jgi:hypothetical protein